MADTDVARPATAPATATANERCAAVVWASPMTNTRRATSVRSRAPARAVLTKGSTGPPWTAASPTPIPRVNQMAAPTATTTPAMKVMVAA